MGDYGRNLLHYSVKYDKRWPVIVLDVPEVTEVLVEVWQSRKRMFPFVQKRCKIKIDLQ